MQLIVYFSRFELLERYLTVIPDLIGSAWPSTLFAVLLWFFSLPAKLAGVALLKTYLAIYPKLCIYSAAARTCFIDNLMFSWPTNTAHWHEASELTKCTKLSLFWTLLVSRQSACGNFIDQSAWSLSKPYAHVSYRDSRIWTWINSSIRKLSYYRL